MTNEELERIYNEAYRAVYWTAFALLKNEADAEDVVQDTFVALIESYDTIQDKSKVIPWLKKSAANKALNRLTRTKTDSMDDEFFDSVEAVPEDFLPDTLIESEAMRKVIMDIIYNSLSEDVRRTLILFYFDEMSIKEIANVLEVPEGTVSRRLNFARNKIKKEVEKYEEDKNSRLFAAMALPFLSKLFIKEAELVAFKPMPASLANINLSASAKASAKEAGLNASMKAAKKGTEIMMKKLIIWIVAGIVAVAAIAGTIVIITKKVKKDSDPTKISRTHSEDDDDQDRYADDDHESDLQESDGADAYYDSDDYDEDPYVPYIIEDLSAEETVDLFFSYKNAVASMDFGDFDAFRAYVDTQAPEYSEGDPDEEDLMLFWAPLPDPKGTDFVDYMDISINTFAFWEETDFTMEIAIDDPAKVQAIEDAFVARATSGEYESCEPYDGDGVFDGGHWIRISADQEYVIFYTVYNEGSDDYICYMHLNWGNDVKTT